MVNSRTGSIGVQILLDDAEELLAQGKTLDECEFILKDYASKVESFFVCRDLKFLSKCGRLSSFEATLGTLLKIVPIIHVDPKDDKLRVAEKHLGKKLAYKIIDGEGLTTQRAIVTMKNSFHSKATKNFIALCKEKL